MLGILRSRKLQFVKSYSLYSILSVSKTLIYISIPSTMRPLYITCALMYLAVFTGPGAKADIQCHNCVWTTLGNFYSEPDCKYDPTNTTLTNYQSPVTIPDRAAKSGQLFQTMSDIIGAVHDIRVSDGAEQETNTVYTTICGTAALKLEVAGEPADFIIRLGVSFKPEDLDLTGKCLSSWPPGLEDSLREDILETIKDGVFCYCDTDGCNSDIIQVPQA